jgi:hypothetical protein
VPVDSFERSQVLQRMFFTQYSYEPKIAVARSWAHAGVSVSLADRAADRTARRRWRR